MTFRETIMRTFRREPIDHVVWQPRLYYWYYANGLRNRRPAGYHHPDGEFVGTVVEPYEEGYVPEELRELSMIEVYRAVGASPRYPQETLGVDMFHCPIDERKVKITTKEEGDARTTVWETPQGTLTQFSLHGYPEERLVKGPDDFPALAYILDNTDFFFDHEAFRIADETFGDSGVINTYYPRSPLQRLIVEYMGFENTVFCLHDYPQQTSEIMKAIEAFDDRMYEVLVDVPVRVYCFGENIDAFIDPPTYFGEYLLPYYEKRLAQLHAAGKFCHIHMDGALKPLLPFLKQLSFDAIEAATPVPQGDVTIEELHDAMGDKILIDGIPALYFLPSFSLEDLEDCVKKLLKLFGPRLILGASDEVPPGGEIERVRMVGEWVAAYSIADEI